jgi:DNA ligase-1
MLTRPALCAKLITKDEPFTDEYILAKLKAFVKFPVAASFKADGWRGILPDEFLRSRSFKLIPNLQLQERSKALPRLFDLENYSQDLTFQQIDSICKRASADASKIDFWILDWYSDEPYIDRINRAADWVTKHPEIGCKLLTPKLCYSPEELLAFEKEALEQKFEGICFRDPWGKYKCGYSTLKEGYLTKLKRFIDEEAIIVGFKEEEENQNEQTKDAFGLSKRSSHQANKTGKGTLGAFIVRTPRGEFSVGTGPTASQRQSFWERRDSLIGKVVTVKFFPIGIKDLPRHPVFKGFRNDL